MKMRRPFVYVERAAAVVVRTLTAYGAGILKFGGHKEGSAMYMSAACSSANLHCGYENGEALWFSAVIDVIRNLQRCSTWKEARWRRAQRRRG